MQLTTLALLILIPLLIWRVYLRLKQFFVRQESLMWKHWVGAVLFPLMLLAAVLVLAIALGVKTGSHIGIEVLDAAGNVLHEEQDQHHGRDVDAAPLRLMADVFLMGARENGPDFEW